MNLKYLLIIIMLISISNLYSTSCSPIPTNHVYCTPSQNLLDMVKNGPTNDKNNTLATLNSFTNSSNYKIFLFDEEYKKYFFFSENPSEIYFNNNFSKVFFIGSNLINKTIENINLFCKYQITEDEIKNKTMGRKYSILFIEKELDIKYNYQNCLNMNYTDLKYFTLEKSEIKENCKIRQSNYCSFTVTKKNYKIYFWVFTFIIFLFVIIYKYLKKE